MGIKKNKKTLVHIKLAYIFENTSKYNVSNVGK